MTKRMVLLILMIVSVVHATGQEELYMDGRANMARADYQTALTQLNNALEIKKGDTEILYHLGICHFRLNNNPAALEAFYGVEKRREGMGSFYLAKTEVRLNHPELALKYLRVHLSSRYKVPEKVILLDEELSRLEGTQGWQNLWNEKVWYSQGDQDFQEAQFLKENDKALEAINLLNKLEKQGYQRSKVQAEKADVYTMLGNHKAAKSELQSSVKSDVRNLNALYALASFQVEEGDTKEALAGLNRVIRQEPDRFDAYLVRARARSDQEDLAGALDDVNLYLKYFPEQHDAYYQRGKIQHTHGKYLDAIQSYNRALEMDNGKAAYFYARGLTYATTGTTRYAEKDLSMALDLDPFNGEIWYEKGKLSEQLGQLKEACSCYQKAFQYGIFDAGEILDKLCN
jgi:tetratricopeptide (TPR) repeat protein